MKKILIAIGMIMLLPFTFGATLFYDDFNDGNVTSDNWAVSFGDPAESEGYLNSTNAGLGGGIYQQFTNMTWYDTEWNVYINATYRRDAADDYVMFTLGDATDTSGNTFYIKYIFNVGFNGTYYLETVFYGDCTIEDGGLGAVAIDINYTEQNLLRIYHRANNTMTVYSNEDEVGTFTVTGCNYSNFYNILYIRNLGVGVDDYLIEYNATESYPAFSVAIHSPANHTTTNQKLNITYSVTNNATCDLRINSALNDTMSAYQGNNTFFVDDMVNDSTYNYYINCTDIYNQTAKTEVYHYHFSAQAPLILVRYPQHTNDTIYSNFKMNITGNITDENLFRVNVSIFNITGTQFYNNYSGDLANGTTFYDISTSLNTTTWANGWYYLFVDTADAHTAKEFKETITEQRKIVDNEIESKLKLSKSDATFKLGKDLDIEYIQDFDRFKFKLKTKKQGQQTFDFTATEPLIEIKNSKYACHYVFGKYWFDCEGLENVDVTQIDEFTIHITFDMSTDEVLTESLGGLNENNDTILFQIDNCVSAWICTGYGSCAINDTAPCDTVIDSNYCGLPYAGDYSEFARGTCDYCVVNFVNVSIYSQDCVGNETHAAYTWYMGQDANFSSCCNTTLLDEDCEEAIPPFVSNLGLELYPLQYNYNYGNGTIQFTVKCSQFNYVSEDLPKIVIDGTGKVLAQFVAFGVIFGMLLVLLGVAILVRKIKR